MHIEYLKIFDDLGRYRSFSHTAQANSISQAAVSKVVSRLEKRLGVLLVDRSTRPLQLTERGRTFHDGCRNLVEEFNRLEAAIGAAPARLPSKVLVAAIYSVGLRDMSRYVEFFRQQNPNVEVQIEYLHPAAVYDKVLEGIADFGLISYPRRSPKLAVLRWREEEMLLACSPNHPLAPHRSIRLAQLDGEQYIGFTRELPIRQKIDRFLRKHGISVDVILEFDNIEYVKKALELGRGVALLPEPMLKREVESGTLTAIPLSGPRLVRPLSIVYRNTPKLSHAAQDFIRLIRRPERSVQETALVRKLRLRSAASDHAVLPHRRKVRPSSRGEAGRGA